MSQKFENDLKDLSLPYTMEVGTGSTTLLITFAGISGALGLYPFEFFKITKGFNVDKIFIRDLNQSWYHKGLTNSTKDIKGTASYLKKIIKKHKYKKVVCLGNSMGGYAAMVIGHLIKADTILSFSPQTFLDNKNRLKYNDNRWQEQIDNLPTNLDKKYLDIYKLYAKKQNKNSTIKIFYSSDERIDVEHVKRLEDFDSVELFSYEDGGHQLVQHLRANGELYRVLRNNLTPFSEDRIISIFQDIENDIPMEEALKRANVKKKKFLKYENVYKTAQDFQGIILYDFFNSIKNDFTNKYNLIDVDKLITNKYIYSLDYCVEWFSKSATKKQMFGSYFYFGHSDYLLHLEVGTNNLHIGIVKYTKVDDNYKIIKMDKDDFTYVLKNYNHINMENKLIQRNWGSGWCSIDCGTYIDLSFIDRYLTLHQFIDSKIYKNSILPLIKTAKKDIYMNKIYNKSIFTPGPVKMYEETLKIGALQTPYFRNDEFSQITLECEENLLKIANAPDGSKVLFLTASGTAGMEATVQNLLNKNDKALVVNGGGFGQRFVDICKLHHIKTIDCKVENNNLFDTTVLNHFTDATALLINAHETSIGTLYDLKSVGEFTKQNKMLHIVDAISMFITDELDMQKFNIDALVISSHKGLALPPGLSMVILTPKAIQKINPTHQLYFDFNSYLKDGLRGQTPFTPAVTIILQLQARLEQIMQDGINSQQEKAKEIAKYFRESIKELPLELYSSYMPNAMTTLTPTDGKSASDIVKDLDKLFEIIVTPNGGELRDKIFRVSHMGDMTKEYTDILINALYDYYKIKRER